jgi:cytochrome c556
MRHTRPILAALWLLSLGGLAAAQDSEAPEPLTPEEAHEVREAHMKIYGAQLGILGPMAQGAAPYDAAAAQAAADAILANATSEDWLVMWPEGSAQARCPTAALCPDLGTGRGLRGQAPGAGRGRDGAPSGRGTDLASLQAAIGGVGQSCGSCHETYRASEE